jgi:uncharacterized protein (TIGR00375 family)
MHFIADLHIHSRYSRATSKDMSPESIWRWAQLKGITVIGTGDFTHPAWFKELNDKLEPSGNGLFRLKKEFHLNNTPDSCRADVYFMPTAEISCIYTKNGRVRKIHSIILVPDFACALRLNRALSKIGNLGADGRPILGLDAKKLLSIMMDVSPDAMMIPAHAWTPHFSIFGSESGFDSLEECFEELSQYIYAIETGLSSDPAMNWRLSSLDRITLTSHSDAHSPNKIGREANIFDNIFDAGISYERMINAIKTKTGFHGTIEFFPEEGKYHFDGHRLCNISLSPKETSKYNDLCPVCGRRLTIGVMHRVEKLADRESGFKPSGSPNYYSIIPLPEIIAETMKVGVNAKKVDNEYQRLLEKLGNEFKILMSLPIDDIEKAGSPIIGEAISRMRSGHVHIAPGFDGVYGKIKIFETVEREKIKGQRMLF